ncbi:hypothetical protein AaE_010647 [Aphanomyces astaci]|uniref:Protein kinase domain-containing protein n=1 Tax=Aphanomyces astaci TaxID=112090 RepID=A0A6A4ZXA4_APHAT|nr:hypothetical protein AaE_010647 [Aphanomyces astaci]
MWRTHTPVVVKCFDTSSSCERELDLWFGLRHPHVLTLYGACHVGARPFALCEVARASLDQCIVECEQPLSHEKLSRWLWEAALGVQHLHGQNAVHGDLKCNNLLVTHDGHVKVADFGCSFHVHRGDRPPRSSPTMNVGENECQEEGGLRWTAPECLTSSSRTFASDVYALGLCFVEAATRNVPFPECTTDATVKDAIRNNLLPDLSRDNGICTALHSLIASMCCADPSSRPSIATVVDALHDILQAAPQAATCSYCASSLLATALFCHSCGSVVQKPCEDAPSTHLVDPLPSQAPSLLTSEGSTTTPVEVVVREYGYALKSVTEESATDDTKDDASKRRLHRQSLHLSTSDVQLMVANDDVDSLVNLLVHGRGPIQERALQALHNMTSDATKLVASGVIDPLVLLTTRVEIYVSWSRDSHECETRATPTCKELAAAVLGHLAFRRADIAATIRNQGGVTALLKLLRHGTFVQRSFALRGLAHITAVDAASCAMVVADNGLAAVYDMLRGGSGQLLEHAMWVLANLSDEADDFALDVSVLPPVVTEVEDMSYDQQHHALRLLANSIGVLPRKITVTLIPVLVTMLRRRQHTHVLVQALATAAYISDEFATQVVEAGAVPLLWTLFQQNQHPQACLVALNNVAISDDCRIDSFVPIVAWVVQQLAPRRRDGTPFVDRALELLQNVLATTPSRCEEAFLSAGGVAILLKLLPKCTSHRVSAVLANVATRAETVGTMAKEPETVHILATTAGPPSSHLERLHALRCIANMTFFEPGVMVGVKGRGIPLMFDLLAKPREPQGRRAELQTLALAILFHLAHHPPFQTLLIDDPAVIRKLRAFAAQTNRPSSNVALSTLRLLNVGTATTAFHAPFSATSIYAVAVAKLKRAVFASNQDEEKQIESLATVLPLLQHPKTRRRALDVLTQQIPHGIKPEDIVASKEAFETILAALGATPTRLSALRVVALIVDHMDSKLLSPILHERMHPPLMYITKHGRSEAERSMATEAVMTLGCHGDRKSSVMDDLIPESRSLLDEY